MAAISDKVSTPPQNGDGSNKAFAFDFSIIAPGDIGVYVDRIEKDYPDDYDVVFGGTSGTVTFHEAPPAGTQILLVSQPDYSQTSEFADQGAYNLSTVNTINRRAAIRDLVTEDKASRALKVPLGETPLEMRSLADADGNVLGIVNGEIAPVENTTVAVASDVAAAKAAAMQAAGYALLTAGDRTATAQDQAAAQVAKQDAQAIVGEVADALAAGTTSDLIGNRIYASRALLNADLVPSDGLYALVMGDATPANNDVYKKHGATTTGSWSAPLGFFAAASALARNAADIAVAAAASLTAAFPEMAVAYTSRNALKKMIIDSGASKRAYAYQNYAFTSGATYQLRAVVRMAEFQYFQHFCNAGCMFSAVFDLLAGKVTSTGAGTTAEIRPLGNGWYLCIATCTAIATATGPCIAAIGSTALPAQTPITGDGVSGAFIAAMSLTINNTFTELFTSRFVQDASWTKNTCTFADAIVENTKPTGGMVDDLYTQVYGSFPTRLIEAAGNGAPSLYKLSPVVTGRLYRSWAIAKAGARSSLNIFTPNGLTPREGTFDLIAGTCTGAGAQITPLGDGQFLCEVIGISPVTSTVHPNLQFRIFPASGGHPYVGDGTSGL